MVGLDGVHRRRRRPGDPDARPIQLGRAEHGGHRWLDGAPGEEPTDPNEREAVAEDRLTHAGDPEEPHEKLAARRHLGRLGDQTWPRVVDLERAWVRLGAVV